MILKSSDTDFYENYNCNFKAIFYTSNLVLEETLYGGALFGSRKPSTTLAT